MWKRRQEDQKHGKFSKRRRSWKEREIDQNDSDTSDTDTETIVPEELSDSETIVVGGQEFVVVDEWSETDEVMSGNDKDEVVTEEVQGENVEPGEIVDDGNVLVVPDLDEWFREFDLVREVEVEYEEPEVAEYGDEEVPAGRSLLDYANQDEEVPAGRSLLDYANQDEEVPAGRSLLDNANQDQEDSAEPQVLSGTALMAPAPEVASETKKKKPYCRICRAHVDEGLRRHIERKHLPWYLAPTKCCWSCYSSVKGHCFLDDAHPNCQNNKVTDERLCHWVLLCNGLLHFLVKTLRLESPHHLFQFVLHHQMYSRKTSGLDLSLEQRVSFYLFERLNDGHFEVTDLNNISISPPSSIATLLHWKVLSYIVSHLSIEEQIQLIGLELPMAWDGSVHPDPRTLTMPNECVDSHLHMEKLIERAKVTEWWHIERLCQTADVKITGLVANFVFPEKWQEIGKFKDLPFVKYSVGIHPHAVSEKELDITLYNELRQLVQEPGCVAIGEVGLDYFHHNSDQERKNQVLALKNIVNWACEFDKVLVIHCRGSPREPEGGATLDLLEILKEDVNENHPIHVHSFCGSVQEVKLWKESFKNAKFGISTKLLRSTKDEYFTLATAISSLPLEDILLESDSPYLMVPRSQHLFNHPWNLGRLAEEVAKIKKVSTSIILAATQYNAVKLYGSF